MKKNISVEELWGRTLKLNKNSEEYLRWRKKLSLDESIGDGEKYFYRKGELASKKNLKLNQNMEEYLQLQRMLRLDVCTATGKDYSHWRWALGSRKKTEVESEHRWIFTVTKTNEFRCKHW